MRYAIARFRRYIPSIQGVKLWTSLTAYQIYTIEDDSWDLFTAACEGLTRYVEITEDECMIGTKFYGEVRPFRKAYSEDEGLVPDEDENGKTKVYFDDHSYEVTFSLMKTVAKSMISDEFDTRESRDGEEELLTTIDECVTIRELNVKREELLGIERPKAQLIDEGLWDSETNQRVEKCDYSLGF